MPEFPAEVITLEVRFTAAMFLNYYLSQHGLTMKDIGVAPTVLATWFPHLAEHLATATGAARCQHWPYAHRQLHLYRGELGSVPFSIVTLPIGAPSTVAHLEELVTAGATRFIGLGLAGSLQQTAPIGSFLLPGLCIREEGTSAHYLPPEVEVGPDAALVETLAVALDNAGLTTHRGRHWTTDAPYREFVWKIEQYAADGVYGVDMETSAMYALGQFHGLPVANVLVISDELWHQWNPAFGRADVRAALRRAADAVVTALPAIAGDSRS